MSHAGTGKNSPHLFTERASSGLAGRYVQALAALAKEANIFPQIAQDCAKLDAMLRDVPNLGKIIRDPSWSRQAAAELMRQVTVPLTLSPLTQKFIGLVIAKGRLPHLPEMLAEFAAEQRRFAGEVEAEIVSAAPLTKAQLDQLQKAIEASLDLKITLKHHIDANLIGGLVLRLGTWMVDFSLQNKLNRLQHVLQQEGA